MFLIATVTDTVPVAAQNLSKPTARAVQEVLEGLFLDRVIPDLGLGITIYNILELKGGFVYPSDSAAYFQVRFELVVFRPVKGEILTGRLARSDRSGVHVTLGFFSDIIVPDYGMQQPSFFKNDTTEWFWKFGDDEMYLEPDEPIRMRVTDVKFRTSPTPGEMKQALATQPPESVEGTAAKPFAAMQVFADINEDGLGMTAWWQESQEAEQEEGPEGDMEPAADGNAEGQAQAEMEEDG